MLQEVLTCMRNAHTVHAFNEQAVEQAAVEQILEAGCMAPSAGNLQPWYFFVVTDRELKERLAAKCINQPQVAQAPVVIAVFADPARSNEMFKERGAQLYCLQDTAAAAENMVLAATAQGIGSCWVGAFDEVAVQHLLEAPPRLRAVALLCFGYSADSSTTAPKQRLSRQEVSKWIS